MLHKLTIYISKWHGFSLEAWKNTCTVLVSWRVWICFLFFDKDPYKSFGMPSIGRLEKYIEPAHIDQVSVSLFYFEYHDFIKLSSCAQKWIFWLINFILPNVILWDHNFELILVIIFCELLIRKLASCESHKVKII